MIDFARRVGRPEPAADAERLGDEIAELAAHLHAATYELLVKLREFDRLEAWGVGFRSCAHWLSWRTGIAPGAAREKVRVARALASLPVISEAMRHGQLSYAKVRALTRIATPTNEAQLLEVALHGTAAHVEKVMRAWRRVDRNEEAAAEQAHHERRKLDVWIDDDGSWVVRGRLDPESGALLAKALDAAAEALYGRRKDPEVGASQKRADAIGLITETALRVGFEPDAPVHRADRFRVVVHVDEEALREGSQEGQSVLKGVRVPAETSRRIACDAGVITEPESRLDPTLPVTAENPTLKVTAERVSPTPPVRRTRTIPAPIRRALEHRDRGCRFPGCGLRFCDAHHCARPNGRTTGGARPECLELHAAVERPAAGRGLGASRAAHRMIP